MPSKLITIGEILEMRPGDRQNATWINEDFEAVLTDPKLGSGKAPNSAVLTDPHNSGIAIVASLFGIDPTRYNNKVIHVSGKGITRTEYKGVQQITLGDKATIQIVGDAKPSQAPTPAQKQAAGIPNAEGQAIGNAITNACALIRDSLPEDAERWLQSAEFSRELWIVASDILRVSRALNAGKLAEPAKVRNEDPKAKAEREAAEKAAAEKAEAERKAQEEAAARAANQTTASNAGIDEDVPF